MEKLSILVLAAFFLAAGCSSGVVSIGNTIRSSIPEKTNTLLDAWPQAGSVLLALGHPVQLNTYTVVHGISGDGIMVIDVKSHDFDPIAAVIDEDGNLVAFNDNWKETTGARLVLEGAPSGCKLLVFSPDDSRGLYDIIVEEGTSEDLETFINVTDFSSGTLIGRIEEGTYNAYLADFLREVLEDDVYNSNYPQAQLFPFTIDNGEQLTSITLESDDFDPYLVLMTVEDGTFSFVEYNDDYDGSNSRIIRNLDAGDYIALVMPYSTGSSGRFTLKLESIDEEALEKVEIHAHQQDTDYTGEIVNDRNFAIAFWPDMMDSGEISGFLNPFAPVAGFTFTVENTAVYEINASAETDTYLTLLRTDGESNQYVASNDDYGELGLNSRIVQPLMSGEYTALISQYSGSAEGEVTFSWSEDDTVISTLRSGRSTEVYAPYETESIMFQLNLQAGNSYSISVESEELDPTITLVFPDGGTLYNDDGGENTNSLLDFAATETQAGDCFLIVEKYSSGEGTFTILLEASGR